MKQRLLKLVTRIDALTLRERLMLFAAAAASIIFLLYALFLNPLLARQSALRLQISQQQGNIAGIDNEVTQKMQAYEADPDALARKRLDMLKADIAQRSDSLRAVQKGLVAPERIAPLLESILKANGRLQLVSMTTLPVSPMSESAFAIKSASAAPTGPEKAVLARIEAAAQPAAERAPAAPIELLYRHGVELSMRGNYLDMVNYMGALEAMPAQLFWGHAQLEVEEYPNARLTLTLYTMSLDRKWMKL